MNPGAAPLPNPRPARSSRGEGARWSHAHCVFSLSSPGGEGWGEEALWIPGSWKVAQTSGLLYRRLPVGSRPKRWNVRTCPEPAGWKPAIQQTRGPRYVATREIRVVRG